MPRLELATDLYEDQLATQFDLFVRVVHESSWMSRVRAISVDTRGNPLLRNFLLEENRVVFALAEIGRMRTERMSFPKPSHFSKAMYEAFALIGLFTNLYSKLEEREGRSLVARLRGAFANPDDLRALQFEWVIAIHLAKRGFHLDFSDETKGGTFDLLAVRDGVETEIECKSVGHKRGRQIQRHEALRTLSMFKKDFSSFTKNLTGGLVVRVILPGRLPTTYSDQKNLCNSIRAVLLTGEAVTNEETEVRVSEFSVADSPFKTQETNQEELRAFLSERFSINNRETMALYSPGNRAFVLSLESKDDDNVVGAIFHVIKDACDRQLTGRRPAIVCVKLEAIEANELAEIAEEQTRRPTELRIATSRFLDARRTSHLAALAFFSDGELLQVSGGHTTQEGRSYFFSNSESPFYNEVTASVLS